jgi:hypothetical protein
MTTPAIEMANNLIAGRHIAGSNINPAANTHQCPASTTQYFHDTIGMVEKQALMPSQPIHTALICRKKLLEKAARIRPGFLNTNHPKPKPEIAMSGSAGTLSFHKPKEYSNDQGSKANKTLYKEESHAGG